MEMPCILVADTDINLRVTLTHLLEYAGYAVHATIPGEEIVRCAANGRYELLLLDIDIPSFQGLSLLAKIRYLAPNLPIIVLTKCHDVRTARYANDLAITNYFVKPINPALLLDKINLVLSSPHTSYP